MAHVRDCLTGKSKKGAQEALHCLSDLAKATSAGVKTTSGGGGTFAVSQNALVSPTHASKAADYLVEVMDARFLQNISMVLDAMFGSGLTPGLISALTVISGIPAPVSDPAEVDEQG